MMLESINQELFNTPSQASYIPSERRFYYEKIFNQYLKCYNKYKVTTEEESKNKLIHFLALLNFELICKYQYTRGIALITKKNSEAVWDLSLTKATPLIAARNEFETWRKAADLGKTLNNTFRLLAPNIRCFSCFEKLDFTSEYFGRTIKERTKKLRKLVASIKQSNDWITFMHIVQGKPEEELRWIYHHNNPHDFFDKHSTLVKGLYQHFLSKKIIEPIAPEDQLHNDDYSDLVLGFERIKFNPSAYAVQG